MEKNVCKRQLKTRHAPNMVTSFVNKQHLAVYILVLTYICSNEEDTKLITQSYSTCRQGRDQRVNANLCLCIQTLHLNLTKCTYCTYYIYYQEYKY